MTAKLSCHFPFTSLSVISHCFLLLFCFVCFFAVHLRQYDSILSMACTWILSVLKIYSHHQHHHLDFPVFITSTRLTSMSHIPRMQSSDAEMSCLLLCMYTSPWTLSLNTASITSMNSYAPLI